MNSIINKIIITAVLSLSLVSVTQAKRPNIITGPPPHIWSEVFIISGVGHGVSDLTLARCNQKLADATAGTVYTLLQPCSRL